MTICVNSASDEVEVFMNIDCSMDRSTRTRTNLGEREEYNANFKDLISLISLM
jgi:hypothetical protein